MKLTHHPDISTLEPEARKVLLFIIRKLAVIQKPDFVKEYGLEKTEEILLNLIETGWVTLCCDRKSDTEAIYWLEG